MADYAVLLRDHVTLRYRSIDRIFLQAYVPNLQSVGLVCKFLRWQRGYHIPSSAAFGRIGDAYLKAIYRFAKQQQIPIVPSRRARIRRSTHVATWKQPPGRVGVEWC
jgi:hypothetical protein